jgi:ubiquinol-cytochrome c reductase iron-sulfur subunit
MSENDEDREAPRTAAEASGSPIERGRHPATTSGEPVETEGSASIADVETTASMGTEPPPGVHPARHIGRRPIASDTEASRAALTRPTDEEKTTRLPLSATGDEPALAEIDAAAGARAERLVGALFLLSVAGTLLFCIGYFVFDLHNSTYGRELNWALGGGLGLSMIGIGAAAIVWAKQLMPHEKAIQERGNHYSLEEDELQAEDIFLKGVGESGFARRPFLRRSMLAALALFPLPFVVALRDMGPLPRKRLRTTPWKKDVRLVYMDSKVPVKLGDLPIGGMTTVMPEGFDTVEKAALAPTLLIRLAPGQNRPAKGRENWAVADHVAYSKICTHAGCPVGLYEQQTHHLLCPCHQSTFDVPNACKVIFGPAARALPQLPIYVDSEGYLRAQAAYDQPVGPSFWERG